MKPINPEKISVNSIIWLKIYSGGERNFSGVTLGPLKDYQAPTAGGPGAKAPREVAKFHFFKRLKVFENEFISQKCQHFSSSKYPFF